MEKEKIIRNLPTELKEKAIANARNPKCNNGAFQPDCDEQEILDTDLIGAFVWNQTPEGGDFWVEVMFGIKEHEGIWD